jgi:type I restriction enzyme M protein
MKTEKIKLSQLEKLLMDVADDLRGKMDAAEYKEYIFGMLFIKRMSDVFDQKRAQLRKNDYKHLDADIFESILEEKITYGDTFFVPKRARWHESFTDENGVEHPPLKHLQNNIGQMLNKALDAIEEANADTLSGIFKGRINFNKEVDGKPIVKNADLKKIIDKFNAFPALVNENFEFPDLLGAAYEYLLKHFADESGKKGGQFYTPNQVVRLLVQLMRPKAGMSVYDPTAGSGGMLIQSQQYIQEQGQNANDLELFGQENDPTVVAICKMNIILHNITRYTVEFGDTLDEPLNVKDGQLMQFDRVIANPPFSQNYNRATMQHPHRFGYGFAPETGKKADLMFVQHMLASCKRTGKVVVVMPHGVLFRGGKEKEIREKMLNADVLEGIISLPPQLFYGTGIPACVMVFDKSKPDHLKNKVFFINADKDYAEGKKQNTLRPEDIEKIDFVFQNKIEEAQYARLVDLDTIAANDYTLNIRRYVDNTPPPEPEDVRAHLVGGVPLAEIERIRQRLCGKFKFDDHPLWLDADQHYKNWAMGDKAAIKICIDNDPQVEKTLLTLGWHLADWWQLAKDDFSMLAPEATLIYTAAEPHGQYLTLSGNKFPKVRQELLDTIKEKFVPVGILDQFQVAGVFVNWWDNIKYDLKTIMQNGWEASLIPDEYLIAEFFGAEQAELETLQAQQAEHEAALEEAVEEALTLVEFEPDEEEGEGKPTPALAKAELKTQIDYLLKEKKQPDTAKPYQAAEAKIKYYETEVKDSKALLKEKQADLALKLLLKRYGSDDEKADLLNLLNAAQLELDKLNLEVEALIAPFKADLGEVTDFEQRKKATATLEKDLRKDPNPDADSLLKLAQVMEAQKAWKELSKPYTARLKDQSLLLTKLSRLDQLLTAIGGIIDPEQSQKLILKKHFDLINTQLQRYLNAEKRALVAAYENLHHKYATSTQQLEAQRQQTLTDLHQFLTQLNYISEWN